LQGTVTTGGAPTSYHFEYGTTASYGSSVPVPDANADPASGPQLVAQQISGLTPQTTYHFRLVAPNAGGVSDGPDVTFQTPAAVPMVSTSAAIAITPLAATLQGTVNAEGLPTSYHFEYGTTTSYGSSVPVPDANADPAPGPQLVAQQISGLTPGTTYHFRLVAHNADGISNGPDATFVTPAPPLVVSTGAAAAITPNGAQLQGTITTGGLPTNYHFEYGKTTSYGSSVPVPDASAGLAPGPQPVTQQISGLTPGTTYHFRLVAHNVDGAPAGSDATFVTDGPAPVVSTGAPVMLRMGVQFTGTVNAQGLPTSYHFEYGTTTSYGSSIQASSAGSGSTPQAVSQALSKGLTAGTRYHCRIVATNSANRTATGADVAFTYAPRGE
jgi:hypothetical protein